MSIRFLHATTEEAETSSEVMKLTYETGNRQIQLVALI